MAIALQLRLEKDRRTVPGRLGRDWLVFMRPVVFAFNCHPFLQILLEDAELLSHPLCWFGLAFVEVLHADLLGPFGFALDLGDILRDFEDKFLLWVFILAEECEIHVLQLSLVTETVQQRTDVHLFLLTQLLLPLMHLPLRSHIDPRLLLPPGLHHQVAVVLVDLQVLEDIAIVLRLLDLLRPEGSVDGPDLPLLGDDALPHADDQSFALVVDEVVLNPLEESLVDLDVALHVALKTEVEGGVAGVRIVSLVWLVDLLHRLHLDHHIVDLLQVKVDVVIPCHMRAEVGGKGASGVQAAPKLRLRRCWHNHCFLRLGLENAHLTHRPGSNKLSFLLLPTALLQLLQLLPVHKLHRILVQMLLALLLAVEAAHPTHARILLDLDLGLDLLGLLGIDVDVPFADLPLRLAVVDAVAAVGVGAALFLLPHLPKLLQLDYVVLLPAVFIAQVLDQTPLVFVVVVLEFDLLRLPLDLVQHDLDEHVGLFFVQVAQLYAHLDVLLQLPDHLLVHVHVGVHQLPHHHLRLFVSPLVVVHQLHAQLFEKFLVFNQTEEGGSAVNVLHLLPSVVLLP